MSEVLKLNLKDNLDFIETKMSQDKICISCLSKDVPFVILSNCEHVKAFDFLLDYKVEFIDSLICYRCHGMLKKILNFKNQANESINKLYNESNKRKTSKPQLQYSKLEITSTINSESLKTEITELNNFPFEISIKFEESDYDTDLPLLEIKKEKAKSKSKVKSKYHKKFDGKIRVVTLSMNEVVEERRLEELKSSYMRLPYKCKSCITGFDYEENLKNHMERRHSEREGGMTCHICSSVLGNQISLDEHYKRHFTRHECVDCGKRCNSVYTVLKHYNENHGLIKTSFACKMCDFTTESERVYRYHRNKEHKEKKVCKVCGNTFVNSAGLRVHLFTVHGQSGRVHACQSCGKVYRAKSGLLAHVSAKHAPPAPAYCAPCDTHFPTQLGLKNHLRNHSRHCAKRYTCNECDAKFIVKKSLLEHIDWVHMNNTEHACHTCMKVFKNGTCLKRHQEYVHEKKRPPRNKICDHCGRGFTTLAILRAHVRTHTGERPLQCTHCPATFAHSAALYTHNKLLHKNKAQ